MTVTTTTPLSVEEWANAREAEQAPKAKRDAAALAAVREALPSLEDAAESAELDTNVLRTKARDLNTTTPTAADWNEATARLDIAREELAGAREAEQRLARRQINTDARIGVPVAEALGKYFGVAHRATFVKADPHASVAAPSIIVSVAETKAAPGGMFTGTVDLTLYRTGIYKTLDGQALTSALEAADVPVSFSAATASNGIRTIAVADGREVDTVQLRIGPIPLGPPVLRQLSPNMPHTIANVFHVDLATELGLRMSAGGRDSSFVYEAPGRGLAGLVHDAELITDEIKRHVRTASVRATFYLEGLQGLELSAVWDATERVVAQWERSTLAWLGEVTEVTITHDAEQPNSTRLHSTIHDTEAWAKADAPQTNWVAGFENVTSITITVTATSHTKEVGK